MGITSNMSKTVLLAFGFYVFVSLELSCAAQGLPCKDEGFFCPVFQGMYCHCHSLLLSEVTSMYLLGEALVCSENGALSEKNGLAV